MKLRTTTLVTLALIAGCNSSCGGNHKRVSWPSVVSCADVVRDDLLATVMRLLTQPDPEAGETAAIGDHAVAELERMAQQHGASVVTCVVDSAVRSFEAAVAERTAHEQPVAATRKSMQRAPEEPITTTLPELQPEELGAARGRDFLSRVAGTRVEGTAK